MLRQINRLLVFLILLSAALFIVLKNRESVTLQYAPSSFVTASSGLIFIGIFVTGFLVASFIGMILGLKSLFREKKLVAQERQRRQFEEQMLRARAFGISHNWDRAREEWQKIVKKDPDHVIARVELSRAYEGAGDLREALRVLDIARPTHHHNIELLFRAAEINAALGNKTAAIDNLALLIAQGYNERALTMARDLSEELGRIDDAVEYQDQLERSGDAQGDSQTVKARLEYKRLLKESAGNNEKLRIILSDFVRQSPGCDQALLKLSELTIASGDVEAAADLLARRAKLNPKPANWLAVAELWLSASKISASDRATRVISAARSAVTNASTSDKGLAELSYAYVLLSLNKPDDARVVLDKTTNKSSTLYLSLKGLCLLRQGQTSGSAQIWEQAVKEEMTKVLSFEIKLPKQISEAPATIYSTP